MFRKAIVRIPGANFAEGLTDVSQGRLGRPDHGRALEQHTAYREALTSCGLQLTVMEPDLAHPDSTFVEDTAVLVPGAAILTRPGAPSRDGEVAAIREPLARFFERYHEIAAPGTVDGGDICEAERHVFIGLSQRTNPEGARQLAGFLKREGFTSSVVDVRSSSAILHLKSGISYLGDDALVVIDELALAPQFGGYRLIRVDPEEAYAANCVRVNDRVLFPAGFPRLEASLRQAGFDPLTLEMSEYRKMDGGLSCLSLRF
jgi:dimethylargininase